MKFIKDNYYEAIKLYINQIGITIFSFVLHLAVSTLEGNAENAEMYKWIMFAVSVFSVLFYYALIYCAMWDQGAKDKIRVDGGRMDRQMYKGTLIGVMGNAINILFILLSVVFYPFAINGSGFASGTVAITSLAFRYTNTMYLGITDVVFGLQSEFTLWQYFFNLGLVALSVLVVTLGYVLGMHDKKLFSHTKPKSDK